MFHHLDCVRSARASRMCQIYRTHFNFHRTGWKVLHITIGVWPDSDLVFWLLGCVSATTNGILLLLRCVQHNGWIPFSQILNAMMFCFLLVASTRGSLEHRWLCQPVGDIGNLFEKLWLWFLMVNSIITYRSQSWSQKWACIDRRSTSSEQCCNSISVLDDNGIHWNCFKSNGKSLRNSTKATTPLLTSNDWLVKEYCCQ